jgi:hypothetical protein
MSETKENEKKTPRIVQISAIYDFYEHAEVIYGLDADGEVWVYQWQGEWRRA